MKIYLLERGCHYSSFKLSDWPHCFLLVSLICVCFNRCNEHIKLKKKPEKTFLFFVCSSIDPQLELVPQQKRIAQVLISLVRTNLLCRLVAAPSLMSMWSCVRTAANTLHSYRWILVSMIALFSYPLHEAFSWCQVSVSHAFFLSRIGEIWYFNIPCWCFITIPDEFLFQTWDSWLKLSH